MSSCLWGGGIARFLMPLLTYVQYILSNTVQVTFMEIGTYLLKSILVVAITKTGWKQAHGILFSVHKRYMFLSGDTFDDTL